MNKFKIGDRVAYDDKPHRIGGIIYGSVTKTEALSPSTYEVLFDGYAHTWFMCEHDLQPCIEDVAGEDFDDSCIADHDGYRGACWRFCAIACDHQWKAYVGLTNSFEYCVHCDEKKRSSCE